MEIYGGMSSTYICTTSEIAHLLERHWGLDTLSKRNGDFRHFALHSMALVQVKALGVLMCCVPSRKATKAMCIASQTAYPTLWAVFISCHLASGGLMRFRSQDS